MAVVNSLLDGVLLSGADGVHSGVIAAPAPVEPSDNSMPGMGAFIVFVFLAIALYFILKNMNARMRRMSFREREREARRTDGQQASTSTRRTTTTGRGARREFVRAVLAARA